MEDLYDYISLDKPSESISDITVSCENHLICFAAEEARESGKAVDMKEYIEKLGQESGVWIQSPKICMHYT